MLKIIHTLQASQVLVLHLGTNERCAYKRHSNTQVCQAVINVVMIEYIINVLRKTCYLFYYLWTLASVRWPKILIPY